MRRLASEMRKICEYSFGVIPICKLNSRSIFLWLWPEASTSDEIGARPLCLFIKLIDSWMILDIDLLDCSDLDSHSSITEALAIFVLLLYTLSYKSE